MHHPRFENVIFKDCRFVDTLITKGVFENVKFIGGMFARQAPDDNYKIYSEFTSSTLNNVEFDGVAFKNFELGGLGGDYGVLSFKNITDISGYSVAVFGIGDNSPGLITIENCDIKGAAFIVSGEKSKIYVTNSTFTDSGISGEALSFYAESSSFLGGSSTPDAETAVITKSSLSNRVGTTKNGYFMSLLQNEENSRI